MLLYTGLMWAMALLFFIIGIAIHRGKTNLIHHYHQTKVKESRIWTGLFKRHLRHCPVAVSQRAGGPVGREHTGGAGCGRRPVSRHCCFLWHPVGSPAEIQPGAVLSPSFFSKTQQIKLHARSSHHEGRKPAGVVDWRRTVQGRFFYAAMSALIKLVSCSPVEPQIVQPSSGKRTHSKVKP